MLQRLDWTPRASSLRNAIFRRSSTPPPVLPSGETEDLVAERVAADLEAIMKARRTPAPSAAVSKSRPASSNATGELDEVACLFAGPEQSDEIAWTPDEATAAEIHNGTGTTGEDAWVGRARREQRRSRARQGLAWIMTAGLCAGSVLAAAYLFTGWLPDLTLWVRTLLETLRA